MTNDDVVEKMRRTLGVRADLTAAIGVVARKISAESEGLNPDGVAKHAEAIANLTHALKTLDGETALLNEAMRELEKARAS